MYCSFSSTLLSYAYYLSLHRIVRILKISVWNLQTNLKIEKNSSNGKTIFCKSPPIKTATTWQPTAWKWCTQPCPFEHTDQCNITWARQTRKGITKLRPIQLRIPSPSCNSKSPLTSNRITTAFPRRCLFTYTTKVIPWILGTWILEEAS